MTREPIGIIVPARDAAAKIGVVLRDWSEHFRRVEQPHSFLVVDDGSTDDTAATVERLLEKHPAIRLLKHETPKGFGACLRTAMPDVTEPLVAFVTLDYSYKPTDLDLLLKRFGETIDVFGTPKPVAAASAWRTGLAVPDVWRGVGRGYRLGTRIALGFKPEPLAGWLGLRNHVRSWWLWLVMGVPFFDVTSGLKLFRRELFNRFPIQSDGDFALAEILAKLTFLGTVMAEETLPPRKDAIPATEFGEFGKVLRDARFSSVANREVASPRAVNEENV